MALVPKSQYKGKISGKRQATAAEKRQLGATTYAPGVRRHTLPVHGPVKIAVVWEYYSKNLKKWCVSKTATWEYQNLQAAIDYICKYMEDRKAEPNRSMKGKKYYLSSNGYWKDGKFHQYDNADWDNGITLYSQWIIKGNYLRRVTFEQHAEVSREWKRDYHDPAPDPWTHTGTITVTGKDGRVSKRSVRTYKAADPEDTTQQKKNAHRKEKRAIKREYDAHKMHELGMSPEEYGIYLMDLHELPDKEWTEKYGQNDAWTDYT